VSIWLRHHALSFAQTVRRFATAPFASLLNALVIGVALALPLGGYVILVNFQHLTRGLAIDAQISVFLDREASKPEVGMIEKRLRETEGVRSVEFVARERALAGLKRNPAMVEVIATLRDNPLPDAFVVTLVSNDPGLSRQVEQTVRQFPRVTNVQADSAWVQRVAGLLRVGRTAVVLMATLLSFALVAVTFNTIRLQILTQRDEIEVSKLIGATNTYIRRPFFYLGALQGTLGAVMAWGIVDLALFLLNRDLAELSRLYATEATLESLALADGLAVLCFAAALGWLGAYVSVSKHLYKIEPR
jgi:cell division transport system permease protein